MIRKPVLNILIIALALTVSAGIASACSKDSAVERSCTKTDTGIRCTITGTGDTTADDVRECARTNMHAAAVDGVTVAFENIDGGIAVIKTASTPEGIKALHAQVASDCCAKGAAKAGCDKHAAKHAGCDKAAAKQAGCDKAAAKHAGCDKAAAKHAGCDKAAAKTAGCDKAAATAAANDGCCDKKAKEAHAGCDKKNAKTAAKSGCCAKKEAKTKA